MCDQCWKYTTRCEACGRSFERRKLWYDDYTETDEILDPIPEYVARCDRS